MPRMQVNCPNCRQPTVAEIDQLFDLNVDPVAKQRLLSGAFNIIQCQVCGYQGALATPIVYHDADKELLLTYVPPELNLPRNEQERVIGSLINQVVNNLPQEKRKGYLLSPQTTLTMQGLLERILEADGITREMLEAQQQRMRLIERLASVSDEGVLEEIAKQEDKQIDAEFFSLLSRLIEIAVMSEDQQSARQLGELQQKLLRLTTFGREVQLQSQEVQAALDDLRAAGDELTREKLLDLIIKAPSETRMQALVSLARPAMDYGFFQLLSERIDRARGDGRARLTELRARLLEMTQEIDRQIEAHVRQVRQLIEGILQADNVVEAMEQTLSAVDTYFVREVEQMLQSARQSGDLALSSRLGQMMEVIEKASAAPPEMVLIEALLDLDDEQERQKFLLENQDEITPEFLNMLANIAMQVQSGQGTTGEDPEFAERVVAANRQALRFSMQRSMKA